MLAFTDKDMFVKYDYVSKHTNCHMVTIYILYKVVSIQLCGWHFLTLEFCTNKDQLYRYNFMWLGHYDMPSCWRVLTKVSLRVTFCTNDAHGDDVDEDTTEPDEIQG